MLFPVVTLVVVTFRLLIEESPRKSYKVLQYLHSSSFFAVFFFASPTASKLSSSTSPMMSP